MVGIPARAFSRLGRVGSRSRFICSVYAASDTMRPSRVSACVCVCRAFLLSVYLTLGILGRKLGELESFLPPKNADSALNILGNKDEDLSWVTNDFEEAKRLAKMHDRNIFVDFTGYTCTNCRWMEANIFPLPEVRRTR